MRMYRRLLRMPRCDSSAEHDAFILAAKVCRPPLPQVVSAMRLRLFGRLLRTGPSSLISLLAQLSQYLPDSWLVLIFQDLTWLRAFLADLKDMPAPARI